MSSLTEHLDLESPRFRTIRTEATPTSTRGTRGRMLRIAVVVAIGLALGFFFVHRQKMAAEARLAEATSEGAAQAPAVDVVTITPASATQTLALPGETAAWDDTTIYARVNGYVAKWFVDIGDNVKAGQTLATIETPELDAELRGGKGQTERQHRTSRRQAGPGRFCCDDRQALARIPARRRVRSGARIQEGR